MGFLTRLLKTPDENQEDEGQDEFNAEESGLLMVPSLPSEEAAPAETAGADQPAAEAPAPEGELASPPPQANTEAAQGDLPQSPAGGADPLSLTAESPPAESQTQGAMPAEGQADLGSPSGDTLDLFRATVLSPTDLPSILKDSLVDVSMADLLAEASSVRNGLLAGRAAHAGQQATRDAA
jgi:hypothetical protein